MTASSWFSFVVAAVYATGAENNEGDSGFGFDEADAFADDMETALQDGSDFEGTAGGPVEVQTVAEDTVVVEGAVFVSDGRISADRLDFGSGRFEEVAAFSNSDSGVAAASATRLEFGEAVLVNTRDIEITGQGLSVSFVEAFRDRETTITLADDLSRIGDRFELSGADLLLVEPLTVRNVPPATISVNRTHVGFDPTSNASLDIRLRDHPSVQFEGTGNPAE